MMTKANGARNMGKASMGKIGRLGRGMRKALLTSSSLICAGLGVVSAAHAGTLPVGGTVAAGSASIAANGTSTAINQTSQNAVINWQNFSVGAGNSVDFHLANASGATLNRVTGNTASTIAGQITSNGAVYLVNPNGIAITSTGSVQTGGGFVASTLDIADADFMAGRLNFKGNGASKAVTNAGNISAGQGAYVALLGGAVGNSGTITVPLGRLAMGSGEQVALDLNGGNFMQVAVPSALVTGNSALVDNSGTIVVSGGSVQLQAAVVKGAVRNVINMSGSINADSATGDGGNIHLIGGASTADMSGQVTISGHLSAQATGVSGNGGFIETSGEHVNLMGLTATTLSAHGTSGTWLIDPTDFTIAASGGDATGAQLSAALAAGSVLIAAAGGAAGTYGDVNIDDAVSWSSNLLTLDATRNININAVMSATGTAGFQAVVGDVANTGNGTSAGQLLFGLNSAGFYGRLDIAPTGFFSLNGSEYTILSSLGAQGSTTGNDLQGINGNLSGNYVLGSNIDASATSGWNSGAGFISLGTDGAGSLSGSTLATAGFTGNFNGLGHTVSNLLINQASGELTGLFGFISSTAAVSNVGITGSSTITGLSYVGALAGQNSGILSNVYATENVVANGFVDDDTYAGGLAGYNNGTITNSFAGGNVTGTGFNGFSASIGGTGALVDQVAAAALPIVSQRGQ